MSRERPCLDSTGPRPTGHRVDGATLGDGIARPTAAVVLAAGEGTRMRSSLPKVLHPIGGATLLGHAVAAVAACTPRTSPWSSGHGREHVCDEVAALGERLGRPVVAAAQEEQLGTGHAVRVRAGRAAGRPRPARCS